MGSCAPLSAQATPGVGAGFLVALNGECRPLAPDTSRPVACRGTNRGAVGQHVWHGPRGSTWEAGHERTVRC